MISWASPWDSLIDIIMIIVHFMVKVIWILRNIILWILGVTRIIIKLSIFWLIIVSSYNFSIWVLWMTILNIIRIFIQLALIPHITISRVCHLLNCRSCLMLIVWPIIVCLLHNPFGLPISFDFIWLIVVLHLYYFIFIMVKILD